MNSKTNIIGFIIFISIFIFFLIRTLIFNHKLNEYHLYTVGIINKIESIPRAGIDIDFHFNVNKTVYKSTFQTTGRINELYILKNKKFLIKYYPPNPNNCELLICYPLPDSTNQQIWKTIPYNNYSFLRKNYNLTTRFNCFSRK